MALRERFVIGVDIQGFSVRPARFQKVLQDELVKMLDGAAEAAGLDRGVWDRRAEGDGEVAALPPDVDLIAIVRRFVTALDERLADHNETFDRRAVMRLRVAMHSDVLTEGALGYAGPAFVVLSRLLDSVPVREALVRDPGANLAQIISRTVFEKAVIPEMGGLRPWQFEEVRVHHPDKGFGQTAYLHVPGRVIPPRAEKASAPAPEIVSPVAFPFIPPPREPVPDPALRPAREAAAAVPAREPPREPEPAPELLVFVEDVRAALDADEVERADLLTTAALLAAAGREDTGWLRAPDGAGLPRALLTGLDRAWAGATGGAWGFRAQLDRLAGRGLSDSKNFLQVSLAFGWRRTPQEVLPPYRELVVRGDRDHPFFPTMRSPQAERNFEWHTQWQATVRAVHARFREWE